MIEKLSEALKEKKLLAGSKSVELSLKSGNKLEEVFLSVNCDRKLKERMKVLAGISNIKVTEMSHTSEEIGAACKKPFAITVSAIRKTKE